MPVLIMTTFANLAVLSVFVSFLGCHVSQAAVSHAPMCYNATSDFFTNFVNTFAKDWRGLWIRTNVSGNTYAVTNSTRLWYIPKNETRRPPRILSQINRYSNPRWHSNGDIVRRWVYTPTQMARPVYDNGTVGPANDVIVSFPKNGDAFYISPSALPMAPFFLWEKWLTHPMDANILFSLVAVYVDGVFAFTAFVREVAGMRYYPGRFWGLNTRSRIVERLPSLYQRRVWKRKTVCTSRDGSFCHQTFNTTHMDFGLPMQPKDSMITFEYPDGVFLQVPKNTHDYRHRNLQMLILWNVDRDLKRTSIIEFDRNGFFKSECTTTYSRF